MEPTFERVDKKAYGVRAKVNSAVGEPGLGKCPEQLPSPGEWEVVAKSEHMNPRNESNGSNLKAQAPPQAGMALPAIEVHHITNPCHFWVGILVLHLLSIPALLRKHFNSTPCVVQVISCCQRSFIPPIFADVVRRAAIIESSVVESTVAD
eukprot:5074309-Amphidinium_carterae.1